MNVWLDKASKILDKHQMERHIELFPQQTIFALGKLKEKWSNTAIK